MATRTIFFHISPLAQAVFYLLSLISVGVCFYGFYRRARLWRQGRPLPLLTDWPARLKTLWVQGFLQQRTRRRNYAGKMHLLIFFGFLILFIGTNIVAVEHYGAFLFGNHWFYKGAFYLVCKTVLDLFGLGLVLGTLMALGRRYLSRPPALGQDWKDGAFLVLLLVATVTGFLLEGAGIAADPHRIPYAAFSPIGSLFAGPLHGLSALGYAVIWWVHVPLVLGVIAALPYGRWLHLFVMPFTFTMQPERPMGALEPVSMVQVEETGRIGLGVIDDMTRWELMSLDGCMECGRCTEACPAHAVGKELNPKGIVVDLRRVMAEATYPPAPSLKGRGAIAPAQPSPHKSDSAPQGEKHGDIEAPPSQRGTSDSEKASGNAARSRGELGPSTDVISDESLWACTNCHACVRECPALIRHVDIIDGIRRYRVAEGRLSGTAATALRQMASRENPWGLPASQRLDWASGLDIPTATAGTEYEVLLWVGCAGAFEPRAQKTVRAVAQLLQQAGVKFAVLGPKERCTGDPARRIGDEFLFQQLAEANITTLNGVKAKQIVAHCPHCLNTLKNEYPQFGGQYTVLHHTQYLAQLMAEGRLKIPAGYAESVTYHDPCFLARVNGETLAPRKLLSNAGQIPLQEVKRRESRTFCCGAGGGRMWMEEEPNRRPGVNRAQELLATGAKTVAVACPFCKVMVGDSLAQVAGENAPPVLDVAEVLLAAAANPQPQTAPNTEAQAQ